MNRNRLNDVEKYFNKYLTQNKGNHRNVRGFGDQSTDFCHLRAREYEVVIDDDSFLISVGMHTVECGYDKNGNVHHMTVVAAMRKLNNMMSAYRENFEKVYLSIDPYDPMCNELEKNLFSNIFGIKIEGFIDNYKKQFKYLAKIHHPDYGGNADDFDFFIEMRQMVESEIKLGTFN